MFNIFCKSRLHGNFFLSMIFFSIKWYIKINLPVDLKEILHEKHTASLFYYKVGKNTWEVLCNTHAIDIAHHTIYYTSVCLR